MDRAGISESKRDRKDDEMEFLHGMMEWPERGIVSRVYSAISAP